MKRILILLCMPLMTLGQGWEKTFGGTSHDAGNYVQQTTDGGYIICGETESFGNGESDVYLIKTDSQGDSLWTKTFGGTSFDRGYSVQQTLDKGYIICGLTSSFGNGSADFYIIKTDSNGVEQWNQAFGGTDGDRGNSVKQTTDGGYIITGFKRVTLCKDDVYLIKTDGNGIEQWNKNFGGTESDRGYSVQQTADGGYIIAGGTDNFGNGGWDIWLIKTDGNGIEQWNQAFGGTNHDQGYSVQQTTDGGYIICGETVSFGNGMNDIYLIKTDGNGIEQWNKNFGGTGSDGGRSVQQTTDGGYIIVGYTSSFGNGLADVYLIKTDSQGDSSWTKTFGGTDSDWGYSVQQTTDGGYIISGRRNGLGDFYLIKTDGNGNVTSTFNIPTPSSSRKLEKVVDILGRKTKGKKHEPLFYIYDDGTVEKRIVIE